MKKVLMVAVAMLAAGAYGQNIYVTKSQEKTSADLPMAYDAELTEVVRDGVQLMGTYGSGDGP
jgi:hypothetical protein